ncbi:unnamed protein product [Orchesella dallaii]|uniref:Partial AB-hydrolase lipase domain-containing protein n=1 Tax=Orchesella dallaii TaxID=48710 RepID=A0ABP1PNV5_9HEXA
MWSKLFCLFLAYSFPLLFQCQVNGEILVDIEQLIEDGNLTVPLANHAAIPNVGPAPDEETIRKKAPPHAEELARAAGYSLESHTITTADGYHLVIHRLLAQQPELDNLFRDGNQTHKPVVLLQHGIAQSSSEWLINESGKSLAMFLVDNGYDVWLGNSRGNKYSNSHLTIRGNTMEYYNFTFHEVGQYDIPATIDLVLKVTEQPQLNYIGCSIGATVFFVAMSAHPEYASRVRFMGALSPLAFLSHTQTPIKLLAPHIAEIKDASIKLQVMRINPETLPNMINTQLGKLCFWRQLSRSLCNSIYKMLDEFGLRKIEEEHLDNLWKYIPTTTSSKTFIHLLQLMTNEELFEEYDFGPDGNAKRYGSGVPPEYDLNNVNTPVVIFTGKGEMFSTSQDIEVLKRALPFMVRHMEADSSFKVHTDFTHGANAYEQIFKPILFILNFYNKQT